MFNLVEHISALAAKHGHTVFLLGAKEEVVQDAAARLQTRYPGLKIVGVRNGYFNAEEERAIVAQIAQVKPDILFVALGIPKQEQFIDNHRAELGVPVMIGIGGSLDVISGHLRRAPHWMQHTGLEWLYRLYQEPTRLPRMIALPNFIIAVWRTRRGK